jgi:hypothetical protein
VTVTPESIETGPVDIAWYPLGILKLAPIVALFTKMPLDATICGAYNVPVKFAVASSYFAVSASYA